jgi:Zn-dependent oligopeptidase
MPCIPNLLSDESSVAYDSNRMSRTRRRALLTLLLSPTLSAQGQFPADQRRPDPFPKLPEEDRKLPNGKSQKDAIAKQNHEQSLKDANDLVEAARSLRDELQRAGTYVVPLNSVKKTEEIEKLARRIRGRLKA